MNCLKVEIGLPNAPEGTYIRFLLGLRGAGKKRGKMGGYGGNSAPLDLKSGYPLVLGVNVTRLAPM